MKIFQSTIIILLLSNLLLHNKYLITQNNPIKKIEMDTINTNFERKYDLKTGLEMYNFEAVKSSTTNPVVIKRNNGEIILIYSMSIDGGYYDEFYPDVRRVQKLFYSSGKLKQVSFFYQKNLKVGIWQYYDEQGNMIKEVDEDNKFKKSKLKIKDILKIAEKEGLINLKTGEGRTNVMVKNNQVIITEANFNIMYLENNNKTSLSDPIWYITTQECNFSIVYQINGTTGDIKKSKKQTYSEE